jgi:hypothetical protein
MKMSGVEMVKSKIFDKAEVLKGRGISRDGRPRATSQRTKSIARQPGSHSQPGATTAPQSPCPGYFRMRIPLGGKKKDMSASIQENG